MRPHRIYLVACSMAATTVFSPGSTMAQKFGPWGEPVSAESFGSTSPALNTSATEGCPILDPYTGDLYFASDREGGEGGLDIWRAPWGNGNWGTPENLGPPINSVTNDYCPTPSRGNRLFFVSRRDDPMGDIYVSRRGPNGYRTPERLPDTINSDAQEWSPSFYEDDGDDVLFFSSTRNGNQDIFVSINMGPAIAVSELNTDADDARPNVSRDGLEMVFDTNRGGGAPDIWTSTRASTSDPWRAPVPIAQVNSEAGESRASMSWDGTMLVFGSTRAGGEGSSDIYVSTRQKMGGPKTIDLSETPPLDAR